MADFPWNKPAILGVPPWKPHIGSIPPSPPRWHHGAPSVARARGFGFFAGQLHVLPRALDGGEHVQGPGASGVRDDCGYAYLYIYIYLYGGFQTWRYPRMNGFLRENPMCNTRTKVPRWLAPATLPLDSGQAIPRGWIVGFNPFCRLCMYIYTVYIH